MFPLGAPIIDPIDSKPEVTELEAVLKAPVTAFIFLVSMKKILRRFHLEHRLFLRDSTFHWMNKP